MNARLSVVFLALWSTATAYAKPSYFGSCNRCWWDYLYRCAHHRNQNLSELEWPSRSPYRPGPTGFIGESIYAHTGTIGGRRYTVSSSHDIVDLCGSSHSSTILEVTLLNHGFLADLSLTADGTGAGQKWRSEGTKTGNHTMFPGEDYARADGTTNPIKPSHWYYKNHPGVKMNIGKNPQGQNVYVALDHDRVAPPNKQNQEVSGAWSVDDRGLYHYKIVGLPEHNNKFATTPTSYTNVHPRSQSDATRAPKDWAYVQIIAFSPNSQLAVFQYPSKDEEYGRNGMSGDVTNALYDMRIVSGAGIAYFVYPRECSVLTECLPGAFGGFALNCQPYSRYAPCEFDARVPEPPLTLTTPLGIQRDTFPQVFDTARMSMMAGSVCPMHGWLSDGAYRGYYPDGYFAAPNSWDMTKELKYTTQSGPIRLDPPQYWMDSAYSSWILPGSFRTSTRDIDGHRFGDAGDHATQLWCNIGHPGSLSPTLPTNGDNAFYFQHSEKFNFTQPAYSNGIPVQCCEGHVTRATEGVRDFGVFCGTGSETICSCGEGWGGTLCNDPIPNWETWDPRTATECPTSFDLCMGRGKCVKTRDDGSPGVSCICRPGWMGGGAKTDPLGWRSTDMWVDQYAQQLMNQCFSTHTKEYEITGPHVEWVKKYASLHQCMLWRGGLDDLFDESTKCYTDSYSGDCPRWTVSFKENDPNHMAPIFPYDCGNYAVIGPQWGLSDSVLFTGPAYGGFWCNKCPACNWTNTRECTDKYPDKAPYARSRSHEDADVYCKCKTGWVGETCDVKACPFTEVPGPGGALDFCSAVSGQGVCVDDVPLHHATHCDAEWETLYPYGGSRNAPELVQLQPPPLGYPEFLEDGALPGRYTPILQNRSASGPLDLHQGRCVCADGYGGPNGDCSQKLCAIDRNTNKSCGEHGTCSYSDCPDPIDILPYSTGFFNFGNAYSCTLYWIGRTYCSAFFEDNCYSYGPHTSVDFPERCPEQQCFLAPSGRWPPVNGDLVTPAGTDATISPPSEFGFTDDKASCDDINHLFGVSVPLRLPDPDFETNPESGLTVLPVTDPRYTSWYFDRGIGSGGPSQAMSQVYHRLVGKPGVQTCQRHQWHENCTSFCLFNISNSSCNDIRQRDPCPVIYYHPSNVNMSARSLCKRGECVCEDGWDFDSEGLCTVRRCPKADNGLECNGLTRHDNGQSVCKRDPVNPVCECWEAIEGPKGGSSGSPFNIRDGKHFFGPACNKSYESVCVNPQDNRVCSGPLYSDGCYVDGCQNTWDDCEQLLNLSSAVPYCHCKDDEEGSSGTYCNISACGGLNVFDACSANSNGTIITGECDRASGNCTCYGEDRINKNYPSSPAGVPYVGRYCQTAVPECGGELNVGHHACSGVGRCVPGVGCICPEGYNGTRCQTALPCGGCNLENGVCVDNVCHCFRNYRGAQCQLDMCTASGGNVTGRNTCDCPTGSVQYPNNRDPFWRPPPPDGVSVEDDPLYLIKLNPPNLQSFRGCRKLCASSPWVDDDVECGGYIPDTVDPSVVTTRCRTLILANESESLQPTCACSGSNDLRAPNPNVQQTSGISGNSIYVDWIAYTNQPSGTSTCRPKCAYCFEDAGVCQLHKCVGTEGWSQRAKCQYTGTHCDQTPCDGHANHEYDPSTQTCRCKPVWLYDDTGICNENHTRCVASGGTLPPNWGESGSSNPCVCAYPYRLDLDRNNFATTYGSCVSDCGPHGSVHPSGNSCSCLKGGVITGQYCNETLCENGGVPDYMSDVDGTVDSAPKCRCIEPHWGGTYCNETLCQAGYVNASISNLRCQCYTGWTGMLCDSPHNCSGHGQATSSGSDSACACEPGYGGTWCEINYCALEALDPATHVESVPEPCTGAACVFPGHDYNCKCGDGYLAKFDNSSGVARCTNHTHLDCGAHGRVGTFHHNNSYHCICDTHWTGHRCQYHICGDPTETIRHRLVRVVNETDGYERWACECNWPHFYNFSAGCIANCSHNIALYPETSVYVVPDPEDPFKCKCSDNVSHVLPLAPHWLHSNYTTSIGFHCHLPCDRFGTVNQTATSCTCQENATGRFCEERFSVLAEAPPEFHDTPFYAGIIWGGMILVSTTAFVVHSALSMPQRNVKYQ